MAKLGYSGMKSKGQEYMDTEDSDNINENENL